MSVTWTDGRTSSLTLVVAVEVLFAWSGSASSPATVAVLVIEPVVGGRTLIVRSTWLPGPT